MLSGSPHLDPGSALLGRPPGHLNLNGFSELFVQWAAEWSDFSAAVGAAAAQRRLGRLAPVLALLISTPAPEKRQ
jgi:hypothetical protein